MLHIADVAYTFSTESSLYEIKFKKKKKERNGWIFNVLFIFIFLKGFNRKNDEVTNDCIKWHFATTASHYEIGFNHGWVSYNYPRFLRS